MNQQKIGKFISILRKEKKMTQEQLAERLGVSNRSVSRWENGGSMPDLSLLLILSDELGVTVSELLNGERSEEESKGSTEGIERIIEFSNEERIRKARMSNAYFFGGLICIVIVLLHGQFGILDGIKSPSMQDFIEGLLIGLGISLEIGGFYFNGKMYKFSPKEIDVISSGEKYTKMRTAKEMLQFARKSQNAELKQYQKVFQKIEEKLQPEEYVLFSMVADGYTVDDHPGAWHIGVAVTKEKMFIGSEQVRGRLFTGYEVEEFEISRIEDIRMNGREIQFKTDRAVVKLQGKDLGQLAEDLRHLICEKIRKG